MDQHERNRERFTGQNLIHGLLLPEAIVAGMSEDLLPVTELLQPMTLAQLGRRSCIEECLVGIVLARPPLIARIVGGLLCINKFLIRLAEGAGVEPVLSYPPS